MRQTADALHKAQVIAFPALFRTYAKISGRDRAVKAGTFRIAKSSSWSTILDTLTRGRGVGMNVTIPEGSTLATIESLFIERLQVSPDSFALVKADSALRAQHGIDAATVEGYLFPDTYSLPVGVAVRAAFRTMIERFESGWDSTWTARAAELSLTRHEIITLASIIEREAVVPEERPIISAVYHNRLKIGMPLQADPTVLYARGQHAERVYLKDLEIDSPYNTYKYPGLPPGPIASPGAESIRAALYPAAERYLYFVAHPDGHHEFRNSYAEHLAAKAKVARMRRDTSR
jgi:UPF0755 protein